LGEAPGRAAILDAAVHAAGGPGGAGAAALYDRAAARLRAGDAPGAAEDARAAIRAEPTRLLPRELLAEALEAAGDAPGALAAAREAAALPSADGPAWALVGRLEAVRGDTAAALAAFEAGARADAWAFDACRRAAVLRMSRGGFTDALALLERFLAETAARAADVIAVQPSVGPDAVPGAPPPATAASFSSELAFREALRRDGARRSHVLAAARYEARILTAHALVGLGREDEAVQAVEAAPTEVEGVSRILLMEAGLDLGE